MNEYDSYEFDVSAQPIMTWLTSRLKRGKRDAIDNLARRILADVRIPRKASLSMYRMQLASKKYSGDDLATFERAWSEMKAEVFS